MDATSRIAALAGPAAESAGLVVDGVEVAAAGSRSRVLITVDLPPDAIGSASLDAIAEASRAIGKALDDADTPSGAYVLEVGTPGIDRPLTERHHFMRARTRLVTLQLAGGETITGRLTDVVDTSVHVDVDGALREVALGDITLGRIEVEFKRLDDQADALEADEE